MQVSKGQEIKNRIKGAGISINEISSRLGMSRQAFHSNLSKAVISGEFMEKLTKELSNISFEDLTNDVVDKSKPGNINNLLKDIKPEDRKRLFLKAIELSQHTTEEIANEGVWGDRPFEHHINQDPITKGLIKKAVDNCPYLLPHLEKVIEQYFNKPKGIPYYDLDITAGDIPVYFDESHVRPDHYIDIFGFNNCTHSFPVAGHSMYPKICNGDIGIFQHIKDKSIIDWGSIFLIITSERRLLKYLRKSQKEGYVILASENKEFDDMEIPMDKILELFLYKGKIEKNQM